MTNPHFQSNFKFILRINNSHTLLNGELTSKGRTRTKSIRSLRRSVYPKIFQVCARQRRQWESRLMHSIGPRLVSFQ